MKRLILGAAVAFGLCLAQAHAQTNAVPGIDISLSQLGGMKYWGRIGPFPAGINGFSMSTTACNVGTVSVGWHAPMNTDHPVIGFLIMREEAGRFEQISNRSYVKHGFFATNSGGCGSCSNPGGNPTQLFVGCSDTYGVNTNGDNYYLGAPTEIDAWLGKWTAKCSHFDKGVPPAPPPSDCDSIRSLSSSQAQSLGPVNNRIVVADQDLDHPGANYFYYAHYVVAGEPEANRTNNMASRPFSTTWTGTQWVMSVGPGQIDDTVLARWTGASIGSGTNGADDGRVYVGVTVTPIAGGHHYEYAIHNRDNRRAAGGFRIPIHPSATVTNVGFRDLDGNTANDWVMTRLPNELVFATVDNPVEWNTVYNVWFDSDADALPSSASVDAFHPGAGAPTFMVATSAPLDLCSATSTYCTAKINSLGCLPAIDFSGTPSASAGFGFDVGASQIISSTFGQLFYGLTGAQGSPFQGGTLCVVPPFQRTSVQNSGGSATGVDCTGNFGFDFNAYVALGSDPSLIAGTTVWSQYWGRDNPDPFGTSLTDAVQFTLCP